MQHPSFPLANEIRKTLLENGVLNMNLLRIRFKLFRKGIAASQKDIDKAMGNWGYNFHMQLKWNFLGSKVVLMLS